MWMLTKAILTVILLLSFANASGADNALEQYWKQQRSNHYQPLTIKQLMTAEALFRQHFAGAWNPSLQQQWQQLGFRAEIIEYSQQRLLMIREQPTAQQGRGFYLFRIASTSRLVLQAPHSFKDSYSGSLALQLFEQGDYLAAAWNTTTRDKVDLAHQADSLFNRFTAAFAQSVADGRLLQLHGFAQQKRKTQAGREAQLIISSGSKQLSRHVNAIAECSQKVLQGNVYRYPLEVSELGGTLNVNAATLRSNGHDGFVHLEMSKPLRQRLRKDQQLLSQFNHCLSMGM